MRKLTLTLAVFTFALTSYAGNGEHGDKYCAKKKEGKIVVMHEGTAITAEATLDNGARVKADGTVIMKDGSQMTLKEGECIHKDGTMGMGMKKDKNP